MRFATGSRLAVVLFVPGALVLFGAASPSAARPVFSVGGAASPRVSSARVASGGWEVGVEAVLPSNASPNDPLGGAYLTSVSCPSAGNCSAVGDYRVSAARGEGLLLTETTGSWDVGVEAVLPANAATTTGGASIDSVSCSSTGNCSAVGTYTDASGVGQGLLLTETAGTWEPGVEVTLPANAQSPNPYPTLTSISCASPGNCSAVGTYYDNSENRQGLLLTETAGNWSVGVEATLPPDAAGVQSVSLASVSCASAGNCSAVGAYSTGPATDGGLLLTETAGSWASGVEAVLPAGAATSGQEAGLSSVSCASAGNCSAVGSYDGTYVSLSRIGPIILYAKGLLLTETAGSWSTGVEAALPANADSPNGVAALSSVSCPSAGNCSAAGTYYDDASGVQGLLLTETAGSWTTGVEALPANASSTGGELDPYVGGISSVSCVSPGNCGAAGSEGNLLIQADGSWATGIEPSLPANSAGPGMLLYSISCPSAGNCTAAGAYGTGSSQEGLLIGGSPPTVKLDVAMDGTGTGSVTSAPAGIDCGSSCSVSFDAGTALTLTATPSPGSRFGGWSGGGCSGTGSCVVDTGISEQTVTATFTRLVELDISKSGTGSGRVVSWPLGIDCGPACSASFDLGSSLALTATPSPGSRFSGWSGEGCAGTGSCQLNDLGSDESVTAAFRLLPKCVVPRLKGKSLKTARGDIAAHNCTVGRIKHAASPTVRPGHVISQAPGPGRRLLHGAKVNLVVSKGRR